MGQNTKRMPSTLVHLQNNTARVFCKWLAYFKNVLASIPCVPPPCITHCVWAIESPRLITRVRRNLSLPSLGVVLNQRSIGLH